VIPCANSRALSARSGEEPRAGIGFTGLDHPAVPEWPKIGSQHQE
jgi:hypothetical protein